MLKRTTSIFIIALMLGANVLPVFSSPVACEMPCCTNDGGCCDGMEDGGEMACGMTISSCETPQFFSVLSAPLVVQEHQYQATIQPLISEISPIVASQWHRLPQNHHDDSGPDLFRTLPLII